MNFFSGVYIRVPVDGLKLVIVPCKGPVSIEKVIGWSSGSVADNVI